MARWSVVALVAAAVAGGGCPSQPQQLTAKRYLHEKGVGPTQLAAVSHGQYDPVAPNDSAAGRAQNRRTDLLIRPK